VFSWASANAATTTTARIQPAVSLRKSLANPITTSSSMRTVPTLETLVVRIRTTPDQMSRPASVTTNDGTPVFVITNPWAKPIAVVQRRPAPTAAHHGQPGLSGRSRSVVTTPPTALTYATDRSISPMRRTKTTPIAMIAMYDICSRRFVKFRSLRNVLSRIPKMTTMTPRPTMIGSDPSSPNLTPCHQVWR
jgi:hypothetical protein